MIVIGIDPGTTTGFAVWDPHARLFLAVDSMQLHKALRRVELMKTDVPVDQYRENNAAPLVIFEDARTLRVHHGQNARKGNAVLQGVGSIKRDCAIWEEFLEDMGIPYQAKNWTRGTTKWSAAKFAQVTGWQSRANEHARDAGVIVHGLNLPMAAGIVQAWEQRNKRSATSLSSRKLPPSAGTRARFSSTPGAG